MVAVPLLWWGIRSCAEDDSVPPSPPVSMSENKTPDNELQGMVISLQVENTMLKATIKQTAAELAVQTSRANDYETLYNQNLAELRALKVDYSVALGKWSELQGKAYDIDEVYRQVETLNVRYNWLWDKIQAVNSRTDNTTTTNLTAEKRANFYQMWDLWYKTIK